MTEGGQVAENVAPKRGIAAAHQRPIARLMRKWGWNFKHGTIRRRLFDLASCHYPWWDWGHRGMILTGSDFGGNWSEVGHPTWWYRRIEGARMWRTNYPVHRPKHFQVVTDYAEFSNLTKGLNEDQMYEWKAIGVNSDGELHLGHRYWGGAFYGMPTDELWLLRRYLRIARRRNWYGLRSWLYSQSLHAAVHQKKPFTCQEQPPKGQGGYDHWYCQLGRHHDGEHRYNNYVWTEVGGEKVGAFYKPAHIGSEAPDGS